jgi:hypothetical protein
MLAETFKEGSNPKGYFMSEKLDGVIFYYNNHLKI